MRRDSDQVGWPLIASNPSTGASILVVDDDPVIARLLLRSLSRLRYTVRTVASAEEANEVLSAKRFDLMLLDVELPRMSGVEFLEWALRRDPEMAVIMLTGVDSPDPALECLDRGARTYFVKPIEPDFLHRGIRDALSVRRILVERNELVRADRSVAG